MASPFRFQTLLDYKSRRVDDLRLEMAHKQQALQRLRRERVRLREIHTRVADELRVKMERGLPIHAVRQTYQYLDFLEQALADVDEQIVHAESEVADVRERLAEALKERKTFEKLREYAMAEQRTRLQKREAEALDDLNITRYFHSNSKS